MQTHRDSAMPFFFQQGHRWVLRRIGMNHASVKIAKQQWVNRKETDDERRNGQQNQG
jgi:hypothetical protein